MGVASALPKGKSLNVEALILPQTALLHHPELEPAPPKSRCLYLEAPIPTHTTHLHALLVLHLQRTLGRGGNIQSRSSLHSLRNEIVQRPQGGQDGGVLPQVFHGHFPSGGKQGKGHRKPFHEPSALPAARSGGPSGSPTPLMLSQCPYNIPVSVTTFFGVHWEPTLPISQRRDGGIKVQHATKLLTYTPGGQTDGSQDKVFDNQVARLPHKQSQKAELLGIRNKAHNGGSKDDNHSNANYRITKTLVSVTTISATGTTQKGT